MIRLLFYISFGYFGYLVSGSEVSFTPEPQTIIDGLTNEVRLRCELHDTAPSTSLIGRRDALSSFLIGKRDDDNNLRSSTIGQQSNSLSSVIGRKNDDTDRQLSPQNRRRDTPSTTNVDQVTSIIIMRNDVDVATVTVGRPARVMIDASNIAASGDLAHVLGERGFLEVTITKPTPSQVGEYQCEVNGVTASGHAAMFKVTAEVTTSQPTTADLVKVIQSQQATIASLKHNSTQQQLTIAALQGQLQDLDRAHLQVQLVGGDRRSYGAVLVTYYGSSGYVCDDAFDRNNHGATVVCRMLGFSCGSYEDGNHFTSPTQPHFQLESVQCAGTEQHLGQCPHLPWGVQASCTRGELAGVRCADACL